MTKRKIVEVAAAVIERPGGEFLLGQRAPGTFYPGYWEFPGGKVEANETPHDALVRELKEELEIEVLRATPWIVREHVYEHAHVRLNFFRVHDWRGELRDHVHTGLEWQRADRLTVSPMLPANAPVLAALALPATYGITHAGDVGAEAQLRLLERALTGGLRLIQMREPRLDSAARHGFALEALRLCRAHDARLLVNGEADLAREIGADGVHLTSVQLAATTARPDFALVGASTHTRDELEHAARLGLDFAVLGPVKETATHPGCPGIGWDKFAQLASGLPLPVYALGGLAAADLPTAQAAGAQGVAAIRGAWGE